MCVERYICHMVKWVCHTVKQTFCIKLAICVVKWICYTVKWRSGCLFIKLDLYLVKYVCHIVEWLSYAHTHSEVNFFQ